MRRLVFYVLVASLSLADLAMGEARRLRVVTTIAPLADITANIGGGKIDLHGLIPEGFDSHTFEPTPADVQHILTADLLILNGLHLEIAIEKLLRANKQKKAKIVVLGDRILPQNEWIFDFSFPASGGNPNPHLWLNVAYAIRYAEMIRDHLTAMDPSHSNHYQENTKRYIRLLTHLDETIAKSMATIPETARKLLTYHDSWPYFCRRYKCKVIGAVQPSSFFEPSPNEVARLIDQIRKERVPAIFSSEVFPSKVLTQIGKEGGVQFISTLRDDHFPGLPGSLEHTYIGMMVENIRTMVNALGGHAEVLEKMLSEGGRQ